VRRLSATLAGLLAGLALTWLCLYVLSHANLPSPTVASGCGDAEHCDGRWWTGPLMIAVLLMPAAAFACAGYLAASRRWSGRKVAAAFGLLASAMVLAVSALYAR